MHHTRLHREYQTTVATSQASLVQSTSKKLSTAVSVNASFNPVQPTLQMTSQVILEALNGKRLLVRALLDSGASISLVTGRVAQQLQLKINSLKLNIVGAQGINMEIPHLLLHF